MKISRPFRFTTRAMPCMASSISETVNKVNVLTTASTDFSMSGICSNGQNRLRYGLSRSRNTTSTCGGALTDAASWTCSRHTCGPQGFQTVNMSKLSLLCRMVSGCSGLSSGWPLRIAVTPERAAQVFFTVVDHIWGSPPGELKLKPKYGCEVLYGR